MEQPNHETQQTTSPPEASPTPPSSSQGEKASSVLQVWGVPAAIVFVGLLIAGAILWTAEQRATKVEPTAGSAQPLAQKEGVRPVPPLQKEDHIRGNPNAPLVFIEYSDYECPFCKRFHSTLQAIMETYGKRGEVAWVYRHFPIVSLHPKAVQSAKAAECAAQVAGNDGFWRFTDTYFKNTPSNNRVDLALLPQWAEEAGINRAAFEACLANDADRFQDRIDRQLQEALAAGARGTPFTVILAKKPFNEEARSFFASVNRQVGQQVFTLLSDRQVAMGGALPQGMITALLTVLLPEKES